MAAREAVGWAIVGVLCATLIGTFTGINLGGWVGLTKRVAVTEAIVEERTPITEAGEADRARWLEERAIYEHNLAEISRALCGLGRCPEVRTLPQVARELPSR